MSDEIQRIIARSQALSAEERWDENEELMRDAVTRYPDSPDICIRAAVAQSEKRPDEARRLAHHAAALAPRDAGLLTRCASLLVALKDFQAADRYARAAHAVAPNDFPLSAELAFILGRIAWAHDEDDRAEGLFASAFEVEPDGPRYGAWLARFYAARGDFGRALEVIDEALAHLPGDAALLSLRVDVAEDLEASEPE